MSERWNQLFTEMSFEELQGELEFWEHVPRNTAWRPSPEFSDACVKEIKEELRQRRANGEKPVIEMSDSEWRANMARRAEKLRAVWAELDAEFPRGKMNTPKERTVPETATGSEQISANDAKNT